MIAFLFLDLPKNINNTRQQISHSWSKSSSTVFGLPDSTHSLPTLFSSSSIAHDYQYGDNNNLYNVIINKPMNDIYIHE